jgi:TolB-like protein/tRNA A-37 threonylcarbamoyl transferase component Bud32
MLSPMDATTSRLNAALEGRYVVSRILGQGGMATVYAARDLRHERDVAIKVLAAELAQALGAERFLNEIKTTANLRHPHILPLYDSGNADGLLFYVMPLVEGETLRDRMTREAQLPIADALRIASEVSDALSYAHARGVIHRDIKPENILLEGGHAVVADFGIARAVSAAGGERLTQTGMSVGTPAYMSPEQAVADDALDGRSDLYSLACVVYEMLAGQAPFTGPTAAAIVRQHLTVDAPPITNLRPAVPMHVAGVLQRALAKAPDDRFNPVAAFSAALQSGAQASASAARTTPTTSAPARRRSLGLILTTAAVLVVAAAGAWYVRARSGETTAAPTGVAVLPFAERSADQANAYLGDGIAETLISALANVSGLTVASRTSSFAFRGKETDVRAIGRELSVGTVLEGSVQRAGDQLRITAELVKTADGLTIWSQTFDRKADDIFAVQDEVVRAVVTALQGRAYASSAAFESSVGTRDREAYELYMQGTYFWNRRSLSDFTRAQGLFEKAIARDSTYAAPWSGIANALITQAFVDTTNPVMLLAKAQQAAERARVLAPDLADAHVALAYLRLIKDWDYKGADSAFRSVIERYPRHPMAHKWYGDLLNIVTGPSTAIGEIRMTLSLDPKLAIAMYNLGYVHALLGQPDSALVWYDRGLALAPDLVLALVEAAALRASRGDSAGALAALERLPRVSSRTAGTSIDLERAWGRGGYLELLRTLVAAPESRFLPSERARWLAILGRNDDAFDALDEAIARRDVWAVFNHRRLEFVAMRKDPRWNVMLGKIGLVPNPAVQSSSP